MLPVKRQMGIPGDKPRMRTPIASIVDTPWKLWNELCRWLVYPSVRLTFVSQGIAWGKHWRIYGVPIIQRHRRSYIRVGDDLQLRSTLRSNPLGANHPVMLITWQAGAVIEIGSHYGMTGGTICAARQVTIGQRVAVGANSTISDTDFHPLDPEARRMHLSAARTAPIIIGDDVFVGMNCLILKGVTVGSGSVIGAGSVVTRDVPSGVIVAGNPAAVIGRVCQE